jgi:Zn-dependent alcohol dehydrogenase
MMLTRKGGSCVLTGLTPFGELLVPLMLSDMVLSHKQLKGTLFGGMNSRASTPMLLSMYQSGRLKLDELVTRRYRLEEINDAIADMRDGRNIRGVIEFD